MVEVTLQAGATHAGAQGAAPRAAATNYSHAGEAWASDGAAAVAVCTHAQESARSGQKRSAAWAELSKLQEARVSANADWVFARKPGSDGLEGSPGGGADKRRKPAKRWGISLSVPAETPPVEVIKGSLYIGNRAQAQNWELLQGLAATHIVNVSREVTEPFKDKIKYHQCGIPDTEKADILGAGASSFRFIEDALTSNDSACVLVHCASGVSRSVALVMHYLMRTQGSSCKEALLHIRAVHPAAQPNPGFLSQLEALELKLAGRDDAMRSKSCVGEAQPFERIGSWERAASCEDVGWMTRSSRSPYAASAAPKGGWWSRTPSAVQLSTVGITAEGKDPSVTLTTPHATEKTDIDDDSKSVASTTLASDTTGLSEASECDDSSSNSSPRACSAKPLTPLATGVATPMLFWHRV